MSDAGSQRGLVPVVPQGQLEVASTSGPGGPGPEQAGTMSYRELLQFYVAQTKWPAQAPLPALPYDDLALFYQIQAPVSRYRQRTTLSLSQRVVMRGRIARGRGVVVVIGAARVVHYVCILYIDCWLVCILVVTVAP